MAKVAAVEEMTEEEVSQYTPTTSEILSALAPKESIEAVFEALISRLEAVAAKLESAAAKTDK
jgi:hypothetical protein